MLASLRKVIFNLKRLGKSLANVLATSLQARQLHSLTFLLSFNYVFYYLFIFIDLFYYDTKIVLRLNPTIPTQIHYIYIVMITA